MGLFIRIVPSLVEGFGRVIIEGMACGIPIVASEVGGIPEIITHDKTGFLVPPKNPSALAKASIRFLNDKELARSMGLAARKKVEQEFSVEKMISETEKVYLSLLKAG